MVRLSTLALLTVLALLQGSAVRKAYAEMSAKDWELDEALLKIFTTAMNRSEISEDEFEDFLDANGVTEELLERAIDNKSGYMKELTESLLTNVEDSMQSSRASNSNAFENMERMERSLTDMKTDNEERLKELRKQVEALRFLHKFDPSNTEALETTEKIEKNLNDLEHSTRQDRASIWQAIVELRRRTEHFEKAVKDLEALRIELKEMIARWPGKDASLITKAINLVKHSHNIKRFAEITAENAKIGKEMVEKKIELDLLTGRKELQAEGDAIAAQGKEEL